MKYYSSNEINRKICAIMKLVCVLTHFSCVQLCAILWTAACSAPLSRGFSRQEYCSELPCPPPRTMKFIF